MNAQTIVPSQMVWGLPENSKHRPSWFIGVKLKKHLLGTPKQKKIFNYTNTLRHMAENLKIPLKQWFVTLGAY